MEINKQCADYCISVIRAVMQDGSTPALPKEFSLAELYAFARLHGVEAMVYHGLCRLEMDESDPVWKDWENRAGMLLTQSIVQLAERDRLLLALPGEGIALLPVKGCWLKEQYPEIDYRQMSDLDLLIHQEDVPKANALMLQWGYVWEEDLVENHDSYGKPPYLGIELHRSLLPPEDSHYGYYEKIWEKAVPVDGLPGVFRLKPEDEYIYYIVHLYKHILHAGTGIRSFLDSLVYRKTYPDMDRAYLLRELKLLRLDAFAVCVETLADCWFDTGTPIPQHMEDMQMSILCAGTYGTVSRRVRNEMYALRQRFNSPAAVKIAYLFSTLFLPLKGMRELYPILEKLPVLLPVFWIWRLISRLLFRPRTLKHFLKNTNEEGDKLWSEFNWQEFQSK